MKLSKGPLSNPLGNWWVWEDLNFRPHPYQGCALNQLSYRPTCVDGESYNE